MGYPYEAKTTKGTHLTVIDGDNVTVAAGTWITVHAELGRFATVSVDIPGRAPFGSMVVTDYSAGQHMDVVDLPRLSADASATDAWNAMVRHNRSGVLTEKSGGWQLVTARDVKRHRGEHATLAVLASRPVEVVESIFAMVDRGAIAATDIFTESPAGARAPLPTIQVLVVFARAATLLNGPTECYCSDPLEHGYSPDEVATLPRNADGKHICTRDKTEVTC